MFRPLAAVLHKSKHPNGIVSGESYILLTCSRRITMEIEQARANCKGSIPFPIISCRKGTYRRKLPRNFHRRNPNSIFHEFPMAFEVSDGLIHKLMATKQRLLAGNAEAARAGAARAEPGAWMAANAEKNARKKGDGKGKTGKKGKDGKEMPGKNDWDHVVVVVHLFS